MKFLLLHTPDFLCFYRALASALALCLGLHPAVPWLFTSALMSDLVDGWFFRRYVENHPDWHPWNPLPVSSIDPLCDFAMMLFGTLYAAHYAFGLSPIASLGCGLLTTAFSLGLNALPNLWPKRSELLWTISITTVTHGSILIMLFSVVCAWFANSRHWLASSVIVIIAFYALFLHIGNPGRLIRHPPANWRR